MALFKCDSVCVHMCVSVHLNIVGYVCVCVCDSVFKRIDGYVVFSLSNSVDVLLFFLLVFVSINIVAYLVCVCFFVCVKAFGQWEQEIVIE